MTLQKNFAGLVGARGVKMTVGLAMMFVYARIFGASATYDAWIWALGIFNSAGMLLFGPITETIRAGYLAIDHRDGLTAAEQYMGTSAVMIISGAVVLAAVLLAAAAALLSQDSGQWPETTLFLFALAPRLCGADRPPRAAAIGSVNAITAAQPVRCLCRIATYRPRRGRPPAQGRP